MTAAIESPSSLNLSSSGLLKLLQLCSPSLPIGGFAWSQGLEYAIDSGWLKNEDDISRWLRDIVKYNLSTTDLPLLIRLHKSAQQKDAAQIAYWNQYTLACRETQELLLEDVQMGQALKSLLVDLQELDITLLPDGDISYLSSFALAASHWNIDSEAMLHGWLWGWLENQIAAAIKTVPLGQTAGQRLFHTLQEVLVIAVENAQSTEDDDIGNSLSGQVMASMLHEEQYCRLFRS